jgi:hypothetical protein
MGMWAFAPWDNDEAADWFGEFMDRTHFRAEWLKGINADPEESPGVVRAAAAIFVMLGRVYVWPGKTLDQDLELAIAALSKIVESAEYEESPEVIAAIGQELAELESRRRPGTGQPSAPSAPTKPWWKLW